MYKSFEAKVGLAVTKSTKTRVVASDDSTTYYVILGDIQYNNVSYIISFYFVATLYSQILCQSFSSTVLRQLLCISCIMQWVPHPDIK